MSNRSAISVLAAIVTPILPTSLWAADIIATYDPRDRAQALSRDESFYDLPTYRPAGKATHARLDVRYTESVFNGVHLKHRSYNGGLVGPVIRARPGSTLKIRLANHLSYEPGNGVHDPNVPHQFNTTNLHTHGLHVSPSGNSDNVFLSIAPGSHQDYEIHIPPGHPAGTFWYHAHHHGSVALQLSSGMAGALIIEGGLDRAPALHDMREHVMVLQQFKYRLVPGESAIIHPDDVYTQPSGATPAINGQATPTVTMRPGEIQRWRLIHAGIADPIQLSFDTLKIYAIAFDGLATGTIEELSEDDAWLNPGYRLDILVQAPLEAPEGSSYLVNTEVKDAKKSFRKRIVESTALLKVVIDGQPKNMTLPKPADLAPYAAFQESEVPTDNEVGPAAYRVALQLREEMGHSTYRVNNASYDPSVISRTMQLGTAEEWRLTAIGAHPFHIHVNPFAVKMPPGSDGKTKWRWRDTVMVSEGDETTIRTRFKDYCGKFVLHCHILDHEDQGMMQNLEIRPGPAAPCRPASGIESAANRIPAPTWTLNDPDGRPFKMADLRGEPVLLVFHRGLSCLHCAQQVIALGERRKAFLDQRVRIVAISPDLPDSNELQKIRTDYNLAFTMLADPGKATFSAHGCVSSDGAPLHGLFLIDSSGSIIWSTTGEKPFADLEYLLTLARQSMDSN